MCRVQNVASPGSPSSVPWFPRAPATDSNSSSSNSSSSNSSSSNSSNSNSSNSSNSNISNSSCFFWGAINLIEEGNRFESSYLRYSMIYYRMKRINRKHYLPTSRRQT